MKTKAVVFNEIENAVKVGYQVRDYFDGDFFLECCEDETPAKLEMLKDDAMSIIADFTKIAGETDDELVKNHLEAMCVEIGNLVESGFGLELSQRGCASYAEIKEASRECILDALRRHLTPICRF